jgi:hypothetical protein
LQEFREGKRQGSVISNQTPESISADEKELWNTIQKELEDIGITAAAFFANKDFIFEWFANALASGAFEEQSPDLPNAISLVNSLNDPFEGNFGFIMFQIRLSDVLFVTVQNVSREGPALDARRCEAPHAHIALYNPLNPWAGFLHLIVTVAHASHDSPP